MPLTENKFAVIGLGLFGSAIARQLSQKGAEVLAIDFDENHIDAVKDEVAYAVALDATDKKALRSQNIESMDAVVVAIGDDFEALMLCTVLLLELNVKKIIARANNPQQEMILRKIGVHEILSPEQEVGKIVAEKLIHPNILSCFQLPNDYEIVEITTPPAIVNRTLEDIALRNKYRLNLITIKRETYTNIKGEIVKEHKTIGVPPSDMVIQATDTLVVFGTIKDVQRFIDINQ